MAKYGYEFKKKVVVTCINVEGGKQYLGEFDIASPQHIIEWVNNYKALGDERLKRARKKEVYSFEKSFLL